LVTDFVNLKISRLNFLELLIEVGVRACVNRSECSYVYEYLRLYCISQIKRIV
jgi:hypothetical protein